MANAPFMPWYVGDYLADCGHLSDADHGRYLMLLAHMWRSPECRLPNDNEWLAKKFRRSVEEVVRELRPVIEEFCDCDGNFITQKRLRKEWDAVQKKVRTNRVSAKSRWKKEKDACERNATDDGVRNANAVQQENAVQHARASEPEPEPEPEVRKKDIPSPTDSGVPPPVATVEADVFRRARALLGTSGPGLVAKSRKAGCTDAELLSIFDRFDAGEIGDLATYLGGLVRTRERPSPLPPRDEEFIQMLRNAR